MGVSEYSTQSENDREALDYMLQHGCDDRQGSVFELFRFRANFPHKQTVGLSFKDNNHVYFFLQIQLEIKIKTLTPGDREKERNNLTSTICLSMTCG